MVIVPSMIFLLLVQLRMVCLPHFNNIIPPILISALSAPFYPRTYRLSMGDISPHCADLSFLEIFRLSSLNISLMIPGRL